MFKIGDRVRLIAAPTDNSSYNPSFVPGMCGTVLKISEARVDDYLHVEWDDRIKNGYNVAPECAYGHGWAVLARWCELEAEEDIDFDLSIMEELLK